MFFSKQSPLAGQKRKADGALTRSINPSEAVEMVDLRVSTSDISPGASCRMASMEAGRIAADPPYSYSRNRRVHSLDVSPRTVLDGSQPSSRGARAACPAAPEKKSLRPLSARISKLCRKLRKTGSDLEERVPSFEVVRVCSRELEAHGQYAAVRWEKRRGKLSQLDPQESKSADTAGMAMRRGQGREVKSPRCAPEQSRSIEEDGIDLRKRSKREEACLEIFLAYKLFWESGFDEHDFLGLAGLGSMDRNRGSPVGGGSKWERLDVPATFPNEVRMLGIEKFRIDTKLSVDIWIVDSAVSIMHSDFTCPETVKALVDPGLEDLDLELLDSASYLDSIEEEMIFEDEFGLTRPQPQPSLFSRFTSGGRKIGLQAAGKLQSVAAVPLRLFPKLQKLNESRTKAAEEKHRAQAQEAELANVRPGRGVPGPSNWAEIKYSPRGLDVRYPNTWIRKSIPADQFAQQKAAHEAHWAKSRKIQASINAEGAARATAELKKKLGLDTDLEAQVAAPADEAERSDEELADLMRGPQVDAEIRQREEARYLAAKAAAADDEADDDFDVACGDIELIRFHDSLFQSSERDQTCVQDLEIGDGVFKTIEVPNAAFVADEMSDKGAERRLGISQQGERAAEATPRSQRFDSQLLDEHAKRN